MSEALKEAWTKRLLRVGYGAALGAQTVANMATPGQGQTLRIYYGGARAGSIGGSLVKVQRLRTYFPEHRWGYNLVYVLSNAPYMPQGALRSLRRRGVAIVHNQNGVFYPAWYGGDWQAKNNEMAQAYHLADYVFWQSEFCRRAAERFLGERDRPGEILYNAVDTKRFTPAANPSPGDRFTFLITGKIDSHLFYRIEATLQGFAISRDQGLDARLTIAGWLSSQARDRTLILTESLGIADAVSLTGPYTQDEAPVIYQAADAYVMLKHNDPCPNTVLEALSCGLPVLYSDTGGVGELVGSDAGLALPCEEDWERPHWPEPQAVAEGMSFIALHHGRLSGTARRRAVEQFDIAPWIDRHRTVFSRLIGQRS